jgi:hypothetical protein
LLQKKRVMKHLIERGKQWFFNHILQ